MCTCLSPWLKKEGTNHHQAVVANSNRVQLNHRDQMTHVSLAVKKNVKYWLALVKPRRNKRVKWIECDMCQSWFHSTCQDLKASDVVFITKLAAKGAKWFCTERAKEIQGQSTTVVPQVTKLNHLEKMIGNLGEKIDEYCKGFSSGSGTESLFPLISS